MRKVLGKMERRALGFLLYATTCAASAQAQSVTIRFNGPMLADLGQLADTAHIEHSRCLLGVWRNETLYVAMAYEPQVIAATALFVSTGPCPPFLTQGEFHNHVPRQITLMGEDRGQVWPVEQYCEMSIVDRRAEQRPDPPLLQVIAVTKDVSCAWILLRGHYRRLPHWPPVDAP